MTALDLVSAVTATVEPRGDLSNQLCSDIAMGYIEAALEYERNGIDEHCDDSFSDCGYSVTSIDPVDVHKAVLNVSRYLQAHRDVVREVLDYSLLQHTHKRVTPKQFGLMLYLSGNGFTDAFREGITRDAREYIAESELPAEKMEKLLSRAHIYTDIQPAARRGRLAFTTSLK